MKIVAISDTHMGHRKLTLEDGDVLIHCGDLTNIGTIEQLIEVTNWFATTGRFKHRLLIPGNHDIKFHEFFSSGMVPENIDVLINKEIIVNGVKFYGTPYTPRFGNWAYMLDSDLMEANVEMIPDDVDVLISHGAPQGILDNGLGCPHLGKRVFKIPTLRHHIFGHIHEGASVMPTEVNGVKFHNASCSMDKMEFWNRCVIIEM